MEKYNVRLSREIKWAKLFLLFALVFLAAVILFIPEIPEAFKKDKLLFLGSPLILSPLLILLRNHYQLKNPKFMNMTKRREVDERNLAIDAAAGRTGIKVLCICYYLAMIVSSLMNRTVFYTLLAVFVFSFLVFIMLKFVYSRRM